MNSSTALPQCDDDKYDNFDPASASSIRAIRSMAVPVIDDSYMNPIMYLLAAGVNMPAILTLLGPLMHRSQLAFDSFRSSDIEASTLPVSEPSASSRVRISRNPPTCYVEGEETFICGNVLRSFTETNDGFSCEDTLYLMDVFMRNEFHKLMAALFRKDPGVSLNSMCKPCKSFYTGKVNSWYFCWKNHCAKDIVRFRMFHSDRLREDGSLRLNSFKTKCAHGLIADDGREAS
jgi:hypothetical protein